MDLDVNDDIWEKIRPEGKASGAGLLCGGCIVRRLEVKEGYCFMRLSNGQKVDKLREWIRPYLPWTLNEITEPMDMLANMENHFIVARDLLLVLADVMDGAKELDLDHDCYCELGFECAPCTAESDFRRALTGANEKIAELPPKG